MAVNKLVYLALLAVLPKMVMAVDLPLSWDPVTQDMANAPLPPGKVWYDIYGYIQGQVPSIKGTTDSTSFVRKNVGVGMQCQFIVARLVPDVTKPDMTYIESDPSKEFCKAVNLPEPVKVKLKTVENLKSP